MTVISGNVLLLINVSHATMSQINFDPAAKQSVGSLVNQVFINKLESIKQYLSNRISQDQNHNFLIQNLDSLMAEAISYHIRVTIVGRKEELVEKVKLTNHNCDKLNSCSGFKTITFPCNINSILKNCDLVFLVINSNKNTIPIEKKLVIKAQSENIPLIIIDFNQAPNQIQSWLEDPDLSAINYFKFPLEYTQQYHNFLEPLIAQLFIKIEADLEAELIKIVRKYFFQYKSQYCEEIAQHKQQYFSGSSHQETKAKVQQSFDKFNHILLRHFRLIKQTLQESKQELINPFVSTSAIYHIHQVIHEAIAIEFRDHEKIYLNLVITKDQYYQAIHSHILELYQQHIDLWIDQKWNFLDRELEVFTQFIEKSDRELKILNNLSGTELKMPMIPKPKFDLNKYICVSTVSNINRIIFDYHYTQSTWFKLIIAIAVGLIFFLCTDRLFGFLFLIIQFINLLTGQSTKSLKKKQQTKELKKVVNNKYQNLVKFVADKLIQDINQFLDQQSQCYQKQVATYVKETNDKLTSIREKIILKQNKISELNKIQQDIIKIIEN